jgi:hypothetical protein
MRSPLLICLGFALAWAGSVRGEEMSPYAATVLEDGAAVHSGPSRNYYETGRLHRGAEVEVYRHDQGGWLAIRPPDGSFSLVGSRYLKPTGDGLAEVLEDHVGARIGSLESPDRDVVQVRLARGEQVQLLEPAPVTSPNSSQTWYMIAPPAGEFRWIHESRVDGAVEAPRPRRLPVTREERPLDEDETAPDIAEESKLADDTESDKPRGAQLATYQIDANRRQRTSANEPSDEGWEASNRTQPAARAPREPAAAEETPPVRTAKRDQPAAAAPPTRSGNLRSELDAIELALSQMVAQDSSRWDFDDINRRAEKLLERSATAVERGRSRLLLRKIARFEDIAQDHADVKASGMNRSRPIAPRDVIAPTELAAQPEASPREPLADEAPARSLGFVGVGRLTQVMSRRPGAPLFALVDENRQVKYFVTPTPGMNLRSYVGKQVGITGVAAYNRTYSKQQLTAERVDVLTDGVLRR